MNEQIAARMAEAYGRHSQSYASILEPILRPMAINIVALAGLKKGERLLDLATGTGLIARTAARFTSDSKNTVTGVDISFGALVRARKLAEGKIPFLTGNAHRLPFANGAFDLVTCGLSLSHFTDVSKSLGEIRRVLRPGGRLITTAWGQTGGNPTKAAANEIRAKFLEDMDDPFDSAMDEDLWSDADLGIKTLQQAGFSGVQVTTQLMSGRYKNHAAALDYALAWPLSLYRIGRLDPQDQQKLRQETAAAILEVDDLSWQNDIHYYQANNPRPDQGN